MDLSLRERGGSDSSPNPASPSDEIILALSNYHGGSSHPPPREELIAALTAALNGIGGSGSERKEGGAGSGATSSAASGSSDSSPMSLDDELDRPRSARLGSGATTTTTTDGSSSIVAGAAASWVLRCRLVNNSLSVLDQQVSMSTSAHSAHSPLRRRPSSGRADAIATPSSAAAVAGSFSSSWRRASSGGNDKQEDGAVPSLDEEEERRATPGVRARLAGLREENEMLRHRLAEVEGNLRKALDNVKSFHKAQQQLFNDFVILREKYDDAKAHIAEVLWSYLPAESAFCPSIPGMTAGLHESEKRVGDYDIGEKLGEGQFAKVFSCRRRDGSGGSASGPEFALKVINKDKVSSLASLKRVDSEVGAQRTLRHRGILQVHDVVNGRYGLYVVMDKGGKDLFDFFDEQGDCISEANCRALARSVVDAVAFCHSRGICHRDLKPENILLNCPRGQPIADPTDPRLFQAKLCDFGLCSPFSPGQKLRDFCGSPGFFAPEMITTQSYHGPAVDYWSLGCILLELAVGHDVFCDEWMAAYDYELMQDPGKFAAKLQECIGAISRAMRETLGLNPQLVDFILGLLTFDPEKRLTVEQIVAHPWIALEDGQSFLTGALTDDTSAAAAAATQAKEQKQLAAPAGGRQTPLPPAVADGLKRRARPAPLSFKQGIPEEETETEAEAGPDASPATDKGDDNDEDDEAELQLQEQQQHVLPEQSSSRHVSFDMLGAIPEQLSEQQQLLPPPPPLRGSMSQKLRSKLEQGQKAKASSLQLPPPEPATPALTSVKQLLWDGDAMLRTAEEQVQAQAQAQHMRRLVGASGRRHPPEQQQQHHHHSQQHHSATGGTSGTAASASGAIRANMPPPGF